MPKLGKRHDEMAEIKEILHEQHPQETGGNPPCCLTRNMEKSVHQHASRSNPCSRRIPCAMSADGVPGVPAARHNATNPPIPNCINASAARYRTHHCSSPS